MRATLVACMLGRCAGVGIRRVGIRRVRIGGAAPRLLRTFATLTPEDEGERWSADRSRLELVAIEKRVDELVGAGAVLADARTRVVDLEAASGAETFWDKPDEAQTTLSELAECKALATRLESWAEWRRDATEAVEALGEASTQAAKNDAEAAEELEFYSREARVAIEALIADSSSFELERTMSGPYDACECRLEVRAGAGGLDAQDWAAMLSRMYSRFCERRDMRVVEVERSEGEHPNGIKSSTLEIKSRGAFGLLRSERGAHRLVRQSPFNAQAKRQTSFASVELVPIIDDARISKAQLEFTAAELDITTMRCGGAGGQNVNKVETGVRIKHIPTGLTVKCTEERTQLMNKGIAINRLKAKLLVVMDEQHATRLQELRGDRVAADFGASVRNYVLHPYKLVKDARTGYESSQALDVLDGNIGDFLDAALLHRASHNTNTP